MATSAKTAKGTTIKIKVGAATVFTKIAELKDFNGLGDGEASVLDATHLESAAKEKILGLSDEGQLTFTHNYNSTDDGQKILESTRKDGVIASFELTFAGQKHTWDGFVMSTSKSGSVDKINDLVWKCEVSGPITAAVAV